GGNDQLCQGHIFGGRCGGFPEMHVIRLIPDFPDNSASSEIYRSRSRETREGLPRLVRMQSRDSRWRRGCVLIEGIVIAQQKERTNAVGEQGINNRLIG